MAKRRAKRKDTAPTSKASLKFHFDPPTALTKRQADYIHAIHHKEMVVTLGPAGTGKSFIAAAYAAFYFNTDHVDTIILTRPTVAVGKSIGFFPGTLEEKMAPWTAPFLSVLTDYLGKGKIEMMVKNGQLQIIPFEVIRGYTFNNAFVILDEAQNATPEEIKAFVTRQGEGSTTIINGDIRQSDLKTNDGLSYILKIIKKSAALTESVGVVEFTSEDVVRSGLCKQFVQAFENEELTS